MKPEDIFVFERMIVDEETEEERLIYKFDEEENKYIPLQPVTIVSEDNRTNFIFNSL